MGGSETEIIQAERPPTASQTAEEVFQARLKFDPLIAEQTQQIQERFLPQQTALQTQLAQQFGPQLSQLLTDIQKQQLPQLRELQAEMFPQQTQVLEAAAGQALGGLERPEFGQLQQQGMQQALSQLQQPQSPLMQALGQQAMSGLTPTGVSPEQQASIDAIRGRQVEQLQRGLRGRAQLGGQLFGGRSEQLEQRGVGELRQGFAAEDVNRLLQQQGMAQQFGLGVAGQQQAGQQQALQNAFAIQQQQMQQAQPFMNILFPQAGAQMPSTSPFQFQSAVPGADQLLQQIAASQRASTVLPGSPSPIPGLVGTLGGAFLGGPAGAALGANLFGG